MCGIAGIAAHDGLTEAEGLALPSMLARIAHRGPDDGGHYLTRQVALGHRRLGVIDLETGRQPIGNETETVWAVVNGEFYNFLELRDDLVTQGHLFRTATDSESLLHLYEEQGERCVESLYGMFAFALWDERERKILLARDRLGVKPLYYHVDGRRLIFASELKAILAAPGVPRRLDPAALIDYLTFGFIPAPKTIFKDIRKLPAGHVLTYQAGRATVRQYWDLLHQGWSTRNADEIAEELWGRLEQATRPRLIADVPIGAFLSGGLDSTAVVATMARLARNEIVTVTCGFQERPYDERAAARDVATHLGTRHHEEMVRPDAAEIIDKLSRHFDEPFADPSAIAMYYLSQRARRHVTVALSGDGGDEALAGYRRYRFDLHENRVRRFMPARLRRAIFSPMASAWPSSPWLPRPFRARATLRNLARDPATAHGLSIATMDPEELQFLTNKDLTCELGEYDPLDRVRDLYARCDAPDPLSKCQYVDLRLGLADGILTKVDRASMAHALEVRSPMLDHRFIEFAWSIPPSQRIRHRSGKVPLREAVKRHVGCRAPLRPKAGFDVPLDLWFSGPLRERFHDTLLDADTALSGWISPDAIRKTWQDHAQGKQRCGPTLWKLTVLDAWCRTYLSRQTKPETCGAPIEIPSRSDSRQPASTSPCIR